MSASISICIPSYNHEKYVRTAIESALAQSSPAAEILISDDCSPDRSYEIAKEYEVVPRVRVMRPPQRTTLGGHYRFLLEQTHCDYVCFLSSDDALAPQFIETMQRELAGEENVGMIASACLECDANLEPRKLRGGRLPQTTLQPPQGFRYFTKGNTYTISFALLSRCILRSLPAIPPRGDRATDWCWALLVGIQGKIKFVRHPMGYYRIHGSNAGHDNEDAWLDACAAMLEFLKAHLPPGLDGELDERRAGIDALIKRRGAGTVQLTKVHGLTAQAKNLIKSAAAFRYRFLPTAIRKAERGERTAL